MLGIAGGTAQLPRETLEATRVMIERMRTPGVPASERIVATTLYQSIALGHAGYDEPDPSNDPSGEIYQQDGSSIVYSGTILNTRELSGAEPHDGPRRSIDVAAALLRTYLAEGPEFVKELHGAFSIAIWDRPNERLFLARDRYGIKPLYFWHRGSLFFFASKLRSLLSTHFVSAELSQVGIYNYLRYGSVPEPYTAVEDVFALPPAHWATFADGMLQYHQYWDMFGNSAVQSRTLNDAITEIRPLMADSVQRLTTDGHPTCVFLSGGIDSSLIAALMKQETGSVNTVSITLGDDPLSEESRINLIARHLESKHLSFPLESATARDWLDDYFEAMDQPSVDGFNAYVVSRVAAGNGFRSALYGIGGDELFGEIWRFNDIRKLEAIAHLPSVITAPAGWVIGHVWRDTRGAKTREWLAGGAVPGGSYDFLGRLHLDRELKRLWRGASWVSAAVLPVNVGDPERYAYMSSRLLLAFYSKNVLLRIGDWAGASQGLDVRTPYYAQHIVDWALTLSPELKLGGPKPVLTGMARDLLPEQLLTMPKMGFHVPLRTWMRNELRADVQAGLTDLPDSIAELLDRRQVQRTWDRYLETGERWKCSWSLYALSRWWQSVTGIEPH